MDPIFIKIETAISAHQRQIDTYGGIHGIRSIELLQSAMGMPTQTFGGEFLHSDIFEMAAAYLYHITNNHPFIDGNKRAGLLLAVMFLEINGISLDVTDEDLFDLALGTAEGRYSKAEIAVQLKKWCEG